MRKIQIVFAAAVMAVFLIFVATLTAGAKVEGASSSREGSTQENTTQAQPPEPDTSISQGTVTGASQSELNAARRDLDQEERLPDYSQVVDNTSADRFDAPGWGQGATNDLAHGGSYASSKAGGTQAARFKLKVPTAGDYALYAWWPSDEANSTAARFGITTASGTKWTIVNQTKAGGLWVKLGNYEMKAGDGYVVRVSPGDGSGRTVADAVALVRGVASPPPDDLAPADSSATYSASKSRSDRVSGRAKIRVGRRHLGTPYRLSPPAPCSAYHKEDCSCLTHLVFRHFDKRLPDSPVKQWQYGHKVRSRAHLKLGDLVFFKESGRNQPITHVGMYAGHGNILHASSYYNKVVESKMKYIRGYHGAKRIVLRR